MSLMSSSDSLNSVQDRAANVKSREVPQFNALKVLDVRRETPDAVSIAFDVDEYSWQYRFVPGQYLTLRRVFDNQEIRRCYSISSGVFDGELRVVVKNMPGGIFSSFANEELVPGMEIDVMTPTGNFGLAPELDSRRNYVGFAVGSGITPIMTIMLSAVSTPRRRGSRWVPPTPGRRPNLTSGSAMLVPGATMR